MKQKLLFAAFVLVFLIILIFPGCKKNPDVPGKSPVTFYQLSDNPEDNSWFREIPDILSVSAESYEPWTQAVRVSDIYEDNSEKISILVNKRGIVSYNCLLQDFSVITHESFEKCTAGKLVSENRDLLCQIYVDSVFAENYVKLPSAFLTIDTDNNSSSYTTVFYPKSTENLSLVSLKNVEGKWFSAWKESSGSQTSFKYFSHLTPTGANAVEISEDIYIFSNEKIENSSFPENVLVFLKELGKLSEEKKIISELEYRKKNIGIAKSMIINNPAGEVIGYEKVCITENNNQFFVAWDGQLFMLENDKFYNITGTGILPDNYNYTALYICENILFAAWEEQEFYYTGASGITMIDILRVDKIPQS